LVLCALQRDSRRIGLWRSGRERGVWLLDLQRASAAQSVTAAAYATVILRDRSATLPNLTMQALETHALVLREGQQ